jgi:hypothetical protein
MVLVYWGGFVKRRFKITLLVENDFETVEEAKAAALTSGVPYVSRDIKQIHDTRTLRQNNAIHLFCQQLAHEFNEHGLEIRTVLSEEIEHPWSCEAVKELIWRPIQKSYVGKTSTTKLDKVKEINSIVDVINRFIGGKWGLYCPFPSLEYQHTKEDI